MENMTSLFGADSLVRFMRDIISQTVRSSRRSCLKKRFYGDNRGIYNCSISGLISQVESMCCYRIFLIRSRNNNNNTEVAQFRKFGVHIPAG